MDIDISSISVHNLGGTNNLYQWFNEGMAVSDPSSSTILSLTGLTVNDFGVYTCQVTNTEVPNLVLYSEEIQLLENVSMEVSSINTIQSPDSVLLGEKNQKVIRVEIVTSGSQSPLTVTDFSFNSIGSTNASADVVKAKLYYTGYKTELVDTILFADAIDFDFSGEQVLKQGTNNFWLVYDISNSATLGNFVDAECNQVIITSNSDTPDITDPDGNNEIVIGNWAALMALYNATNGPNWTNNTNWGTSEPIDSWYGIYQFPEGDLYIYLSDNQLDGTIPSEIENLNMSTLNLNNNQLYGELPDMSGFPEHFELGLINNYFTFEAIEPGYNYGFNMYFEPQLDFQLKNNEIVAAQGDNVDIDISTLSKYSLGGENNLYQWFKAGTEITGASSSSTLSITGLSIDDFGTYTCQVTNTTLPYYSDFTLYSEVIYLRETANAVPTIVEEITDKTEEVGFNSFTVNLTNVFDDTDGDVLSYTVSSSKPGVANTVLIGSEVLIVETGVGTTEISVIASDSKGGSVEDVFIVIVNTAVNNPPTVINEISNQTKEEEFGSFTIDLANVFTDADGDTLTLSAVSSNTNVVAVSVTGNILTVTEVATGNATITVTANDSKGGTVDDEFTVTVNASTSIVDIDKINMKIYPNPTSGIIYFESENTKIENIKVYDITGIMIFEISELEKQQINLSEYKQGIYLINIKTKDRSFTSRIIKK